MIARWAVVAVLLGVALPAAAQPKSDTVSLGYVVSLAQAPYFIALEKGYL